MRSLPGSSQDLLTSTLSAHRHLKSYTPKGHTWQPIVSRSAIQIWIRNEGWALNFSFAIETDGSGQRWQDTEINSPISRSEEHTSELQSRGHLVCRLLLEKKK